MAKSSSARFSSRTSKRGRGGKRHSLPKPFRTQLFSFWAWDCCGCWQHPRMLVRVTTHCPGCAHQRCDRCPVERITMVPGKRLPSRKSLQVPATTRSVSSDADMEDVPIQSPEHHEPEIVPPSEVMLELSELNHLFEPTTISQIASAIELDVESHAPIPTSAPVETMPLIPLIPSQDDEDALFVPRTDEDGALLELWHKTVLPSFTSNPEQWEGLAAVHLFRQGPTERESQPVILVSIEDDSEGIKSYLRDRFSQFFDEPMRSSIRISFEQSTVHRSCGGHLPPICEARNTSFHVFPRGGASIGIQKRLDCTATLGGFLLVDDRPYILTVDHIIPKELVQSPSVSIVHTSEQEGQGKAPWIAVQKFLVSLKDCCTSCNKLWEEHHEQTEFYKRVDLLDSQCPIGIEFRNLKDELFRNFPSKRIGTMKHRSETQSRVSLGGRYDIEMDWALIAIESWTVPLDSHIRELSKNLHFDNVVLGARVRATGRTSGEQSGQVNTAQSIVRHKNPSRFTQEHTVIRDPESSLKDWITGGIGVDGDSGSWIIDRDSGALYGMVWGRDRVTTNPICLFSPIIDTIADIKERTSAKTVCLPGHEVVTSVPTRERRRESLSIPTSFASRRLSEGSASQNMVSNMVSSKG